MLITIPSANIATLSRGLGEVLPILETYLRRMASPCALPDTLDAYVLHLHGGVPVGDDPIGYGVNYTSTVHPTRENTARIRHGLNRFQGLEHQERTVLIAVLGYPQEDDFLKEVKQAGVQPREIIVIKKPDDPHRHCSVRSHANQIVKEMALRDIDRFAVCSSDYLWVRWVGYLLKAGLAPEEFAYDPVPWYAAGKLSEEELLAEAYKLYKYAQADHLILPTDI